MTASVRPLALYKFAQGRGSAQDREDIWHLVDRACTAELRLSLSRMKANPELCIVTVVGVIMVSEAVAMFTSYEQKNK